MQIHKIARGHTQICKIKVHMERRTILHGEAGVIALSGRARFVEAPGF